MIELERLGLKHAQDVVNALNNEKITDNLRDLPRPYTLKDAEEFIAFARSDENVNFVFAIVDNGGFIGCVSATRQSNVHRLTAEIGYYVLPEYQGLGKATQALKLLCGYMAKNTDIIRLFAEPFADNKASRRVLEKSGFGLEGVMKSNAVKNGEVIDMCIYSKIEKR